jgi:hypothetical protein
MYTLCKTDCLDVYLDKKEKVWLIDVNAFGQPSSALLFEWFELMHSTSSTASSFSSSSSSESLLRIVESPEQKLTSTLGSKRGPIDVHLATDFHDFLTICKQQQQDDDDDDDN